MAFQSVPQTVEIAVIYTYNGQVAQNVFYARFAGAYALANLQSMADAVDVIVAANLLILMPIECVYERTEVRGLEFANDITATQNLSSGPGTIAGGAMPNQVTFAIKKLSGLTGRSARGRTYWVGIGKNDVQVGDENRVTATFRTLTTAALEVLRITIAAEFNFSAVLVSRFANGLKRTEGETFPWIGMTSVNDVVDTQRGRLPK